MSTETWKNGIVSDSLRYNSEYLSLFQAPTKVSKNGFAYWNNSKRDCIEGDPIFSFRTFRIESSLSIREGSLFS